MKCAKVFILAVCLVLTASAVVCADVIISQNFDSDTFPVGYQFSSKTTGLGNSSTTEGLWRVGEDSTPGTTAPKPTVSDTYAHSGTKSIVITRPADGQDPYKFEGFTTMTGTPITSGKYEASSWFYRVNSGTNLNWLSFWPIYPGTYGYNCPGVLVNPNRATDQLGARKWTGSSWTWEYFPVVVPTESWFGLAFQVDLSAKNCFLWYNSGSGWTQLNSAPIPLENKAYSVNRLYYVPAGGNGTRTWIDDAVLQTGWVIPEPGTFVLLAGGLLGLLCYAWRKRK